MKKFNLLIICFCCFGWSLIAQSFELWTSKDGVIAHGSTIYRKLKLAESILPIGVINKGTSVLSYIASAESTETYPITNKDFQYCGGGMCYTTLGQWTRAVAVNPGDTLIFGNTNFPENFSYNSEDGVWYGDSLLPDSLTDQVTPSSKGFLAKPHPSVSAKMYRAKITFANNANHEEKVEMYFVFGDIINSIESVCAAEQRFSLFLDPTTDMLHVSTKDGSMDRISVLDITGRMVADSRSYSSSEMNLNIAHLSAGTYMVKVFLGSYSETLKFVKN